MLVSRPLFPADDSPRQMQCIARILGAPDLASISGMKVKESHRALQAALNFTQPVEGWQILRKHKAPLEAADLLSQLLVYKPERRLSALDCLGHSFFDSLREQYVPDDDRGKASLFDFDADEIEACREANLLDLILPAHELALLSSREASPVTSVTI